MIFFFKKEERVGNREKKRREKKREKEKKGGKKKKKKPAHHFHKKDPVWSNAFYSVAREGRLAGRYLAHFIRVTPPMIGTACLHITVLTVLENL